MMHASDMNNDVMLMYRSLVMVLRMSVVMCTAVMHCISDETKIDRSAFMLSSRVDINTMLQYGTV